MRKLTTTTLILISTIAMTNIAMAEDNHCKDRIQITLNMSDKFINNYKYLYYNYNPGGYDYCETFNQATNKDGSDCECDSLNGTYDLETPTPYGKYKPDNEKGFHNEYYGIKLPFGANGSSTDYNTLFTEKNITTDIELSVTWTDEPNTYTIKYEDGTKELSSEDFKYFSDPHARTPTDTKISLKNSAGQYFSAWKCTNCENPDQKNILPNQRIIEPSAQTASTTEIVEITLTPVWQPCPKGYYCPAEEHKIYPCPAGLTTEAEGKSSISDCIVEANKTTIKDSSGQVMNITPQSDIKLKPAMIRP